jgi:opacity protein-like surface antigen
MRAKTSLIAALLLLSALPAAAQPIEADPNWQAPPPEAPPPPDEAGPDWTNGRAYVALRGSYALNANSSTTWAPTAPPTAIRASYATGGGGSLALGAHLPLNLRLELEALYRWQPISRLAVGGVPTAAGGSNRIAAPMLNLFWDVPVPDDYLGLQPFVGMGVGAAYNDTNIYGGGNTYSRQSRWDLAYSFMAGLTLPMSDSSRISAMYRWMQLRDAGHKCAAGGTVQSVCLDNSVSSSSVDLGLEMDL